MALFFSVSKDKSKTTQAIDYINEALAIIDQEEKSLRQSILGAELKIMPVTPANKMGAVYGSISSYKTVDFIGGQLKSKSGYFSKDNTVEQTCNVAMQHGASLFEESKALHEANLPAMENNKLLSNSIKSIMEKIGIYPTYTEYSWKTASGRSSRNRQEHTHTAGYLQDISRCIKTDDGFSVAESSYKSFLSRIEEYKKAELQKEQAANRAKEAEEQKKRDDKELAVLLIKYNLGYQASFKDVLEAIIAKNKYLNLGYWLERQRNSWADGFWKAKQGIDQFTVETATDQAIDNEIRDILEDVDDGRSFRDCNYNYNVLYGMVDDADLMKDFQLVFEKVSSDLD